MRQARQEFGRRLKRLRGMGTQMDIVRALNGLPGAPTTRQAVGNWETGKHLPSVEIVWALEELFEAEPGTLTEPLNMVSRPHDPR